MRPHGGPRYHDRTEAGRVLVDALTAWRGRTDLAVLALPRGGLPVAAPVAEAFTTLLGVIVVRKVGAPGHPELAIGALASVGGHRERILNSSVTRSLGIDQQTFERLAHRESTELDRRVHALGARQLAVREKVAIVVDDGLATGSTMQAAVAALRRQQPAEIVVAVPVGALEAVQLLAAVADTVVCPCTPDPFRAVGLAYQDFSQVADEEVERLLSQFPPRR